MLKQQIMKTKQTKETKKVIKKVNYEMKKVNYIINDAGCKIWFNEEEYKKTLKFY